MKRLVLMALMLGILVLVAAAVAEAQGGSPPGTPAPVSDNDVNRVAKQLYCPVCPNTPLDVCETQACQDWRAQIKDQLGQGWTDQQVIDYFVTQYGERVLAEPKRSGFTSFVWLLPVLALALGAFGLVQLARGWSSQRRVVLGAGPTSAPTAEIPPEVLAELEKELRDMA